MLKFWPVGPVFFSLEFYTKRNNFVFCSFPKHKSQKSNYGVTLHFCQINPIPITLFADHRHKQGMLIVHWAEGSRVNLHFDLVELWYELTASGC